MLILITVFLPETVPFVVTELAIAELGNFICHSLEGNFINVLFFCVASVWFDSYVFPGIHICSPTQHRLVTRINSVYTFGISLCVLRVQENMLLYLRYIKPAKELLCHYLILTLTFYIEFFMSFTDIFKKHTVTQ
jgi:hypothetical protein